MENQITNKETVYDGKWLKLIHAEAKIRGNAVNWLYCTRKDLSAPTAELADVVVIVPFVKNAEGTKILLVEEFRIPLGRTQVGFPAGLIDPGEDVATSVERELLEETGYKVVRVLEESPVLATSAGLTDETYKYVFVEAEYAGEAALEDSEAIELLTLTIDELKALTGGANFCGRAWSLCYHYIQTNQFPL